MRVAAAVGRLPVAARTRGNNLSLLHPQPVPTDRGGHSPVVLVHGYAATVACWTPLATKLAAEGFGVYAFAYNSFTTGLPELAQALADTVTALLEATGADTVHLVGHSLGGLLVRAATEWFGLWPHVATVVTIATPHHGAWLAHAVPGPAGWWLRPRRHTLPAPVFDGRPAPRYLNLHASRDAVVPTDCARLELPGIVNLEIPHSGHLGAPQAPAVLHTLHGRLTAVESTRRSHQRLVAAAA
jgi:pimeloyl-ACP methyl ester carboxylesterase